MTEEQIEKMLEDLVEVVEARCGDTRMSQSDSVECFRYVAEYATDRARTIRQEMDEDEPEEAS